MIFIDRQPPFFRGAIPEVLIPPVCRGVGVPAAFVAVVVAKDAQPKPALRGLATGRQVAARRGNARVKQGNVDLIFIGDSITPGWEGDGGAWRNSTAIATPNLGIGGDQTQRYSGGWITATLTARRRWP